MSHRFRVSIIALVSLFSLAAVLLLYLPAAESAAAPSCVGPDACTGRTGTLGGDACLEERSCFNNSGDIGRSACHGSEACVNNSGDVGQGACHEVAACADNSGGIRKAACIGTRACNGNIGEVGEAACVGDFACNGNRGDIGKLGCRGDSACSGNEGPVGEGSCVGDAACAHSGPGAIGRGACIGESACEGAGAVDAIGNGACRGERACANHPGPVARGACVGPAVNGKGVCEMSIDITLSSLEPDSVPAGSPDLLLVVHGTNFAPASAVRWNGANRQTTFVNPARLHATIPASDLAVPGEAFVDVADLQEALALQAQRVSNSLRFTVR